MKKLLFTLLLGSLITTALGAEDDPGFAEILPKDLPQAIIKVAQKELPDYQVETAIFESGIYSVAMNHKTAPGQYGTLNIDAKGELVGMSLLVKESALPVGVVEALRQKYKAYQSLEIREVSHHVVFEKGARRETYSMQLLFGGSTLSRFVSVDKAGKVISDLSQDERNKESASTE